MVTDRAAGGRQRVSPCRAGTTLLRVAGVCALFSGACWPSIANFGTVQWVPAGVRAGYDAPFPDKTYRRRPGVPTVAPDPDDPAVPGQPRGMGSSWGRWDKPFLAIFGYRDRYFGQSGRSADRFHSRRGGQPKCPALQPLHPGGQRTNPAERMPPGSRQRTATAADEGSAEWRWRWR